MYKKIFILFIQVTKAVKILIFFSKSIHLQVQTEENVITRIQSIKCNFKCIPSKFFSFTHLTASHFRRTRDWICISDSNKITTIYTTFSSSDHVFVWKPLYWLVVNNRYSLPSINLYSFVRKIHQPWRAPIEVIETIGRLPKLLLLLFT